MIERSPEDRVEKAIGTTATTERLARFFMKFRRPAAVGDRRQETMVCPRLAPH
jgi:hypothetical protein